MKLLLCIVEMFFITEITVSATRKIISNSQTVGLSCLVKSGESDWSRHSMFLIKYLYMLRQRVFTITKIETTGRELFSTTKKMAFTRTFVGSIRWNTVYINKSMVSLGVVEVSFQEENFISIFFHFKKNIGPYNNYSKLEQEQRNVLPVFLTGSNDLGKYNCGLSLLRSIVLLKKKSVD